MNRADAHCDPLQTGDPATVGRYRLVGRLGHGGMGVVYLGKDPNGQQVALKLVTRAAGDGLRRFAREIQKARQIEGYFFDACLDAPTPWLATEYIAGPTLQDRVSDGDPLSPQELATVLVGVCTDLMLIHGAGLVHRDLKPANIMLGPEGARVVDLGLAISLDDTRFTFDGSAGTWPYMSPEQVRNERLTSASDVFSLGGVAYFAAKRRLPFGGGEAALKRIPHDEPDMTGVCDPTIGTVITRCLAKEPAARPTPAQIARLCAAFVRDSARSSRHVVPGPSANRPGASWVPLWRAWPAQTVVDPREQPTALVGTDATGHDDPTEGAAGPLAMTELVPPPDRPAASAPGLAYRLAQLVAVLDPEGAPEQVLRSATVRSYLTLDADDSGPEGAPGSSGAAGSSGMVDEREISVALSGLARTGVIDYDTHRGLRAVTMAQPVRREIFAGTERIAVKEFVQVIADALVEVWPTTPAYRDVAAVLRSCASALVAIASEALHAPRLHPVLFAVGHSLEIEGQFRAAVEYWDRLSTDAAKRLGEDDRDTLRARHCLGVAWGAALSTEKAAQILADVLAHQKEALGAADLDTLETRHRLAVLRGEGGDAGQAAAGLSALLLQRTRVRGPLHPDTLRTRRDLAHWTGRQNSPVDAVAALRELHEVCAQTLGQDHPDTLSTRFALAGWCGRAGDAQQAVVELEPVVLDRGRVLGADHPDTLAAQLELAHWRGLAGDALGAVRALESLEGDHDRVLGTEHADTLSLRLELASWRGRAGDPQRAATELADLVPYLENCLVNDYERVWRAWYELGTWLAESAQHNRAAEAYQELELRLASTLGGAHAATLTVRRQRAECLLDAAEYAPAEELLEAMVEPEGRRNSRSVTTYRRGSLTRKNFGTAPPTENPPSPVVDRSRAELSVPFPPDDADPADLRFPLAMCKVKLGRHSEAALLLTDVVKASTTTHGQLHPRTLTARYYLALCRQHRNLVGYPTGDVRSLEHLHEDQARVLGPTHPDTLATLDTLEQFRRQGRETAIFNVVAICALLLAAACFVGGVIWVIAKVLEALGHFVEYLETLANR